MLQTEKLQLYETVGQEAIRLRANETTDYDRLLGAIGDARFVLLGEASHGTHEFYHERAQITKRLVREKGFTGIAVEADLPDADRVNHYIRAIGEDKDAAEALSGFGRFPAWMWRNADVLDLIGWLRDHNDSIRDSAEKTGFYGLDLYSLHTSIEAVLNYLDTADPHAARRARERYSCFDHYGEDTQAYGYAAGLGISESCEDAVVKQLVELHEHASKLAHRDGRAAEEDFFFAEQNARLVKNAEAYYRTMYQSDVSSWNLRDRHMADTIEALDLIFRATEDRRRSPFGSTIRISGTRPRPKWAGAANGTSASWSGSGSETKFFQSGLLPIQAR